MDGNTNARPDGVPPPPSGPRRAANAVDNNNNNNTSSTLAPPPAIRRRPSCQIQRNWDRGEATNNNNSAYDSSAAIAAAARRRSATIASPTREYPPPHLTLQTSRIMTNRNNVNQPPQASNQFQGQGQEQDIGEGALSPHQQQQQHQQARSAYPGSPAAAPPHIRIADQDTPSRNSQYADSSLPEGEGAAGDTDKPIGWAGALMKSGRRRAATVSAALGMSQREQLSPSSNGLGQHHYNDDNNTNNLQVPGTGDNTPSNHIPPSSPRPSHRRGSRASFLSSPSIEHFGSNVNPTNARNEAYDTQVHDLLDVIDPEVQTVNLLGDFQNAFFIPPNRLFDRTRKLQLTKPPESKEAIKYTPPRTDEEQAAADARRAERLEAEEQQQQQQGQPPSRRPSEAEKHAQGVATVQTEGRPTTIAEGEGETPTGEEVTSEKPLPGPPAPPKPAEEAAQAAEEGGIQGPATATDIETIELAQQKYVKGRYFVLPSKLVDMSDWTEQEKADLDDYVRHLMHSKKEIFRRRWRGFKKYVRTPLGAFVTTYASLLTFWGAAWVLFLIGWIPAGDRQAYFVEICDQILVALFCLTGLGLIPWRIRDTYHAFFIIKYHHKTLKLRKRRGLPKLEDENDLPNDQVYNHDLELAGHAQDAVLNDHEQTLLVKHQTALAKSHTYYRPHETFTHHAFPLSWLIAVIVLCDCHSLFQITLGSATWSISYHHWYKKILTTIVLCFSLSCNITGGICIAVGSRLSRKKDVVEALLRQAITEEALRRKEDAERYRAEKRARLQREKEEAEKEAANGGGISSGATGGLLKTGSFPLAATKQAQKLKLMTKRNSSDPGMNEKLFPGIRRSSSSARSSLDSPRGNGSQTPTTESSPSMTRRGGSENMSSSRSGSGLVPPSE